MPPKPHDDANTTALLLCCSAFALLLCFGIYCAVSFFGVADSLADHYHSSNLAGFAARILLPSQSTTPFGENLRISISLTIAAIGVFSAGIGLFILLRGPFSGNRKRLRRKLERHRKLGMLFGNPPRPGY